MSSSGVLVTSGSKKVALFKAVRAAMLKAGISGKLWCGDTNEEVLARYFADGFWKMPETTDAHLGEILAWCRSNEIKLIVPSRDGELEFWAENKPAFAAAGILVMVSDAEAVRVCRDKLEFFKVLSAQGVPAVGTSESLEELYGDEVVVKERFGAGAKGAAVGVDREAALEFARGLASPIFQPFVAGKEFSADFYVTSLGEMKGAVVRERNLVANGESQITTTVTNEAIESICRSVAGDLDLYGHNMLQVILDRPGNPHLVECNARFGGASSLSIAVGLDSFYWLILEALGSDLSAYPFQRVAGQLRQVRYPEDLILPA